MTVCLFDSSQPASLGGAWPCMIECQAGGSWLCWPAAAGLLGGPRLTRPPLPPPSPPASCSAGQAGGQAAAGAGPKLPQEGGWQVLRRHRPLAEVQRAGAQVRAAATTRSATPAWSCSPARINPPCVFAGTPPASHSPSLPACLASAHPPPAHQPACPPAFTSLAAWKAWPSLLSRATSSWCTAWMWRACSWALTTSWWGCWGPGPPYQSHTPAAPAPW